LDGVDVSDGGGRFTRVLSEWDCVEAVPECIVFADGHEASFLSRLASRRLVLGDILTSTGG